MVLFVRNTWESTSYVRMRLLNICTHKIHGTGIFAYIYHKDQPNVGKYDIHGSYGIYSMQIPDSGTTRILGC